MERQGFQDDRTSFARGHANYRGSKGAAGHTLWLSADLNWLTQNPASPHLRQGAALSTATPLDANYNPANAFLDDTRFSVAVGQEQPVLHDARWSLTGSYSHSGQRIFRGFLTGVSNTPNNATGFREDIDINRARVTCEKEEQAENDSQPRRCLQTTMDANGREEIQPDANGWEAGTRARFAGVQRQ